MKTHKYLNPDNHVIFPKDWKPYRANVDDFMWRETGITTVLVTNEGDIYANKTDAAKRLGISINTVHHLEVNHPKKVITSEGVEMVIVRVPKEDILIGYRFNLFQDCVGTILIDEIRNRRKMFENYQNTVKELNNLL